MKQSNITQEDFESINDKFTKDRLALMNGVKTSEYAAAKKRFHNFNAAALMATPWLRNKTGDDNIEMTPVDMAYLFSLKHQVSIVDIVAGKQVSEEQLQEKFGDNANYNDIQHALAVEDVNRYKDAKSPVYSCPMCGSHTVRNKKLAHKEGVFCPECPHVAE